MATALDTTSDLATRRLSGSLGAEVTGLDLRGQLHHEPAALEASACAARMPHKIARRVCVRVP